MGQLRWSCLPASRQVLCPSSNVHCPGRPGVIITVQIRGFHLPSSRLLIAVSTPWASQKVTEPIIDLARRLDAGVIVAHVTRQSDADENEADAKQRGEQTLELLGEAIREQGITCECVLLFSDDVAKAIINTARERECTVVVMGIGKQSLIQRIFGTDVPSEVARQSNLPVLMLPAQWEGLV